MEPQDHPPGDKGIRVLLLGPLAVLGPSGPIPLHRDRHCEIIGIFVANRPHPVSVDHLVDMLWGVDAPASASTTVRAYVSLLRTALGPSVIQTTSGGYVLRVASTDVDEFESSAAQVHEAFTARNYRGAAEWAGRALDIWRGPVLGHLGVRWVHGTEATFRSRLEELQRFVLRCHIESRRALGETASLIPDAAKLRSLDPTDESSALLAADLLGASGRAADGLRALHDHRRALGEAGLEAGERIVRAEQRLLQSDVSEPKPRRAPVAASSRGVHTSASPDTDAFAFVGRHEPLQHLRSWLDHPSEHGVFTVLGEAGIGKTRLLAEIAPDPLRTVVSTACASTESQMPWASLAQATRALLAHVDALPPWARAALASIVPEISDAPTFDERGERIVDAFVRLTVIAGAASPVVWKVDDFHWASTQTVHAVERLEAMASSEVRVVVSSRPVEAEHRGQAVVARSVRAGRSIALALLEESDLLELLGVPNSTAPTPLGPFARTLHRVTQGHPLYITMTLQGLLRRGEIERSENGWTGSALGNPSASLAIPTDDVRTVIEIGLASVPGQARRGLEVLALADRPLATAVWFDAWPLDDAERDAMLASLERSSFVHDVEGASALSHQLVGSVLVDALGSAGRQFIHQRLLRALEDNERRPDPQECFRHARGADDPDRILAWGVEVARRSGRSAPLAWIDDVLAHTRSAADRLGDINPLLALELRRHEMRTAKRAFRADAVLRAADDVLALARSIGDAESEIEALVAKGDALCEAGRLDDGLAILAEGRSIADHTKSLFAGSLYSTMTFFERLSSRRPLAELFDDLDTAVSPIVRAHVAKDLGRLGDAVDQFRRVAADAASNSDLRDEVFAWNNIARVAISLGDSNRAAPALAEARRLAEALGETALVDDEDAALLALVDPGAAAPRLLAHFEGATGSGLEFWAAEIAIVLVDALRRAGMDAEAIRVGRSREGRIAALVAGSTLWAIESFAAAVADLLDGRPDRVVERMTAVWDARDRIDATVVMKSCFLLADAATAAGHRTDSATWIDRGQHLHAELTASLAGIDPFAE